MERKRARSRSRGGALNPVFNVLSLIFLLLSCVSLLCVASVFAVPGLLPAQFQPPTSIALIARPTLIPRTLVPDIPTFPATWTPTDTPTVTPTQPTSTPSPSPTHTEPGPTRTPSDTPTFTLTPTRPGPTATPTNTRSPRPWTLQAGSPTYLQNGINTAGCNWMGITGQAFGLDGRPVLNFYVHLEGGGLLVDAPTGSQPSVGPGGYIIVLDDHPVETTETYKLQLRNASGQPLSDNYIIPTRGDCRQNQILVNFIQNH